MNSTTNDARVDRFNYNYITGMTSELHAIEMFLSVIWGSAQYWYVGVWLQLPTAGKLACRFWLQLPTAEKFLCG